MPVCKRRSRLLRMSNAWTIGSLLGTLCAALLLLLQVIPKDAPVDGMDRLILERTEMSKHEMPDPDLHQSKESVPSLVNSQTAMPSATAVLGKARDQTVYLTIGIPTVSRGDTFYLPQTLDSLIFSATADELRVVTIVVFLGDFNDTKRQKVSQVLEHKYADYLDSGSLVAIQADQAKYPPLEDIVNIYGDSPPRIAWRAKQVVDFYVLWTYCSSRSQYYLQLEDDVITVSSYLTKIRRFIASQSDPWFCLQFSILGFIGKLFRSSDLRSLAEVAAMFYTRHPVDFILQYFLMLSTQKSGQFRHEPALFQHIGKYSSLKNKTQLLMDETFANSTKRHQGDNPRAYLTTNMDVWKNYDLELAYSHLPGFFWARQPQAGQYIFLKLTEAKSLKRVVVETGARGENGRRDILEGGRMDVAQAEGGDVDAAHCATYFYLGDFDKGRLDLDGLDTKLKWEVKCLRITVTENQSHWVIISEIALFVT